MSKKLFIFLAVLGTVVFGAITSQQKHSLPISPKIKEVKKTPVINVRPKSPNDQDWANLARYAASDAILSKLPAGTNQVIFMGDSITDGWNLAQYFPNKPYVNRGISGQTTPQMLVRFRPDLIELQPNATIFLAGTNDIAGNTGFEPFDVIIGNLMSMAELARSHNIKVIIASLLPVCGGVTGSRPPTIINKINLFIKEYCQQTGAIYLDYFSAMKGANGLLRQELTGDCLHPNAAGYQIMAPLAQAAIDKALKK